MDCVAGFLAEDEVADSAGEVFGVGVQAAEGWCVDLQGYPGHLGLEGSEGVGDWEVGCLADSADLNGGKGANQCVLGFGKFM